MLQLVVASNESHTDTDICPIHINISISMSAIHLCHSLSSNLPVYLCSLLVTNLCFYDFLCCICLLSFHHLLSLLLFFFSISLLRSSSKSIFFTHTILALIHGFLDTLCQGNSKHPANRNALHLQDQCVTCAVIAHFMNCLN